ncbi:hypothetical protein [Oceanicola sp. 502str15]|uniref:DUF7002 family protein n=1 Tax=Oceanicola sp. 502str15 TaxID=2696061 RepID=UPI0020945404|nr:hypothetical protein [Oceanicola sp. 502str15]MCO6385190.1 hypothetical protein [Oceanicola sp. 502str15]
MRTEQLVETYPRLWHMAHDGAWPAIRDHGLMSAQALVETYGVDAADRDRLLGTRRPANQALAAPGLPGAVVRDQKPMTDKALLKCLQGDMTPADWYRLLNGRTFFWLAAERVRGLTKARAYRNEPQTVITLRTASLVAAHENDIWLSPLNSGATLYVPQPRGPDTFKRIPDFPFDEREKAKRKPSNNVVELLVDHSVPNIADYVLGVHRMRAGEILEELWRSPEATEADHP